MKKDGMIFMLSLFACLLIDCAIPTWSHPRENGSLEPVRNFSVCIDLPTQHIPEAYSAVEEWNRAIKQWRNLVPVAVISNESCFYTVREVETDKNDDSKVIAWTSSLGGRQIYMKRGRYEFDVKGVLLHELGHALGAQHAPGTLMNETYRKGLSMCPDKTTVAQVAAWNKIDLDLLCWCTL